ncbi:MULTISPECIES: hypothetical protein [unclassified Paenibacillus]|uniref:hypothetical protein n=1 Tax=unclassified Paenibacillus TaxID=185978 RepID=UPI0011B0855F|nr:MULTISPECIES: hypothetical protein [unclassified Paenibacillus]QZN75712.1 hypothetical protein K5K90_30985 [Paenibacillus sp. DR312]
MNTRIDYLKSKGYLNAENYEDLSKNSLFLCNECLLLKNLSLKYAITNNMKTFSAILAKLKEIQLLEKELLTDLLLAVT